MVTINIYKVDSTKHQLFIQKLNASMEYIDTINKEMVQGDTRINYGLSLYLSRPQASRDVGWHWVLAAFSQEDLQREVAPKAVLLIEVNEEQYALTFGYSFFIVDQFCDKDFGFNFARKHKFTEIKTTALVTPSARRNKTVNTYINYNELEFDSGESFAKIKGKAQLEDGFTLFKQTLEIGNSIRITTENESLDTVIEVIQYIEKTIASPIEHYKIPVFSKVSDTDLLATLDAKLRSDVLENPATINIAELDIVGVTEIFNNNDGEFVLKVGSSTKSVSQLSFDTLEEFCNQNSLQMGRVLLDIDVISMKDGTSIRTDPIYKLIDVTDDANRCLLSKGVWYKYNDDYMRYLSDSISEIAVEYHPEFDISSDMLSRYQEQKYTDEKDDPIYAGKTSEQIRTSISKKYYAERSFNNLRHEKDGFENYDRVSYSIDGAKIELMDLYKDGKMFAVKIGKSSSKLCYVVDQSLSSLKMYKHRTLGEMPTIDTVVVWLILEQRNRLNDVEGKPDINELEMMMLKNKLDQWKKEVRLQGLKPLIYINYYID
ncbi:MAG: DUF6119 family protein [Candidatus Limiplasma sp.]|nr:DUF6119 family protein [Candidatus Limiplasma sp.]